jgi:hypothetical protein
MRLHPRFGIAPTIRGTLLPADRFDDVTRLVSEYREQQKPGPVKQPEPATKPAREKAPELTGLPVATRTNHDLRGPAGGESGASSASRTTGPSGPRGSRLYGDLAAATIRRVRPWLPMGVAASERPLAGLRPWHPALIVVASGNDHAAARRARASRVGSALSRNISAALLDYPVGGRCLAEPVRCASFGRPLTPSDQAVACKSAFGWPRAYRL